MSMPVMIVIIVFRVCVMTMGNMVLLHLGGVSGGGWCLCYPRVWKVCGRSGWIILLRRGRIL